MTGTLTEIQEQSIEFLEKLKVAGLPSSSGVRGAEGDTGHSDDEESADG